MFKQALLGAAAALGVLSAQENALQHASWKKRDYYGPGRKEHKRLTDGTRSTTFTRKTRQMERDEAREDGKRFDSRMKARRRGDAAKALSQRASERELREVRRTDSRMTVHEMIERSKGAGTLRRRQLA